MPNYEKSLGQALWLIHEEREMRDRAYDTADKVLMWNSWWLLSCILGAVIEPPPMWWYEIWRGKQSLLWNYIYLDLSSFHRLISFFLCPPHLSMLFPLSPWCTHGDKLSPVFYKRDWIPIQAVISSGCKNVIERIPDWEQNESFSLVAFAQNQQRAFTICRYWTSASLLVVAHCCCWIEKISSFAWERFTFRKAQNSWDWMKKFLYLCF